MFHNLAWQVAAVGAAVSPIICGCTSPSGKFA